jgi:hypothetical protein
LFLAKKEREEKRRERERNGMWEKIREEERRRWSLICSNFGLLI